MNKTCSANQELSYIENVLKTQLLLTTTLFHFGTENWEEKLEEQPVSRHQGNYGQTKVDEDKDTVDYQTTGGKAEMQKAENLENGFSLSGTNSWSNRHTCANSGHFTVISSVLCRAENLDRLESHKPSHEAFSQSRTVLSIKPSISRICDILLKWFS